MTTNNYQHAGIDELVDFFSPELERILQEKFIEIVERIIEIKNQNKIEKENHHITFQRKWLKALEEEREDEGERTQKLYFNSVVEITKNAECDQELSKYVVRTCVEMEIKKLDKKIKSVKNNIFNLSPSYAKRHSGEITEEDIQRAREVQLCDLLGVESGRRLLHCPFHSERTPSFKIFSDNHFKCFGCNEYGDSIDFIQMSREMTFPEAVRFLLGL